MSGDYPLFGRRDTFAAAEARLSIMRADAARQGFTSTPPEIERVRALWQIAFELDRIAAVLEEAHK